MGFQTGNGPHPKEDGRHVSQGAHLQAASQMGLFIEGSPEEVCKSSLPKGEKRF